MTAPRQGKTELSARHHTRLSQNRLPRIEHTPSDSNTTLTPRTPKTTIDPKTTILRFWQAPRDGLKNCWVRAVVAKNAVGGERRRVVVLGATLPRVWHHRDEPVADLPQPPVSLARLVGDEIQRAIAVQPFDLCQFGHVLPQQSPTSTGASHTPCLISAGSSSSMMKSESRKSALTRSNATLLRPIARRMSGCH